MNEYQYNYIFAIENEKKNICKGLEFLSDAATENVRRIHRDLDQYQPTPLLKLDAMAKELGVKAVFVKDESQRFGLNAFKGLGGLYAVICLVCHEMGLDVGQVTFSDLRTPPMRERLKEMVFVTATDGNHGKGVAWAVSQLGCKAHVYMPVGSSERRAQAIRDKGATEVIIRETGYDDTVRYAAKMAEENGWYLIQDTSWDGYEEIPRTIIQGYTTMAAEAAEQINKAGFKAPTHVFLQAGVGAMSGAVLGYFVNHYSEMRPSFGIVEPENVACIYRSAQVHDGAPHEAIHQAPTIMAGLNCGEPCTVTWPILRDYADWYLTCPDYISAYGMRLLAAPKDGDPVIVSGESGAVTTGIFHAIAGKEECKGLREKMKLDKDSVVLLFNTEGDTDPEQYRRIVYEGKIPFPFQ